MITRFKAMKKYKLLLITLGLLAALTLGYAGLALADLHQPGGYGDPLATKSFVEKYVQDYVSQRVDGQGGAAKPGGDAGSNADTNANQSVASPPPQVNPGVSAGTDSNSFNWVIVELEPGDQFIGRDGTEFIIRSGSAVVVDPTGSGIPDLTTGNNIKNGQIAGNNHLFLVPKADGRGITAKKATIIMCRGI